MTARGSRIPWSVPADVELCFDLEEICGPRRFYGGSWERASRLASRGAVLGDLERG